MKGVRNRDFHGIIREIIRRSNTRLLPTSLESCEKILKDLRRLATQHQRTISTIKITHSPWSFHGKVLEDAEQPDSQGYETIATSDATHSPASSSDEVSPENRPAIYRAVYAMAMEGKTPHCPPEHLEKVIEFVRRYGENDPDTVPSQVHPRDLWECTWNWNNLHGQTRFPRRGEPAVKKAGDPMDQKIKILSKMGCVSCGGKISCEGIIGPDGRPAAPLKREPEMEDELAVILPCGHFIGSKCLNRLRHDVSIYEACLICGGSQTYGCGHYYEDLPALEAGGDLSLLPRRGPPPKCDHCLWVDFRVFYDRGVRKLFGESEQALHKIELQSMASQGQGRDLRKAVLMRECQNMLRWMGLFLKFAEEACEAGKKNEQIHSTWSVISPLAEVLGEVLYD